MAQGYGYRSEQRLRKENQDTHGVFEFGGFTLLVVCDGMGGHVGGRQASSIAVRTMHDELEGTDPGGDLRGALRRAVEAANRAIYETARKNYRLMGMGTTCVAAIVADGTAHIAHVGDSRAYLVRDGQVRAITRDHTMVNLFVDAELLSPEDAATHPEAHVLSRSLGVERQVEVELSEPIALQQADRLLLCSDGVHGVIGSSGLGNVDWRNPQEGVDAAIDAVERAEGDDNATLVAFGTEISGASASPTTPPDLASLEEEARQAPVQVQLQPLKRPAPSPTGQAGPAGPPDDVMPVEALDLEHLDDEPEAEPAPGAPAPKARPRRRPTRRGPDRRLLVGVGLLAIVGVGIGLVVLGGDGPPAPAPDTTAPQAATVPEATPLPEPTTVAIDPSTIDAEDALLASTGTSGMSRLNCIDCTGSFALPSAAAYLAGTDDPEVAVAFFAPDVPTAPQRVPSTSSIYDHPPPSGPEQTKAVRAARNERCREALDTVRDAISKSIDYASLYGAVWYCFNTTHQQKLTRARAATWSDFQPLLPMFEGDRRLPKPAPVVASDDDEDAEATGDDAVAEVDAEGGDQATDDEDATSPSGQRMPDTWSMPAEGGLEYRLALFEVDGDLQGFRDIIVDLLGEATVADHLATDVLLEATAAASVARMTDPPPEALQAWARRVYIASRVMTGPVGELIREHRPDAAGLIESFLFEATGGDEGLAAIEEGRANSAVPAVVARAQAAGLAGEIPEIFRRPAGVAADDRYGDPYSDALAAAEMENVPSWRRRDRGGPPGRTPELDGRRSGGDYEWSRSRSRRYSPSRSRSTSGDDIDVEDWVLKVWYPRRRMPRILVPYQQEHERGMREVDPSELEDGDASTE